MEHYALNSAALPPYATSDRDRQLFSLRSESSREFAMTAQQEIDVSAEETTEKQTSESESTEVDPWELVDEDHDIVKWADLSLWMKIWRVLWVTIRLFIGLGCLYLFVCSLDVLQDSFQLLSGRTAGNLFTSPVLYNPVCGLMIGVLVTVLVQSSSTSTSIIVSLVGAGVLGVRQAIPMVMGANIGTTVTNTIVALTQSTERNRFRRSFAGAAVHDMFNWITVLILLPLEAATGYLYHTTKPVVSSVSDIKDTGNPQFLKVITDPLTELIVAVDKKVISAIAEQTDRQKFPLVKYYCETVVAKHLINATDGVNQAVVDSVESQTFTYNVKLINTTSFDLLTWKEVLDHNSTKCSHLFVGSGLPGAGLSEAGVGAILLVGSLAAMIICLLLLVKVLNSMLRGPLKRIVRKAINADFPGKASHLTGYIAMVVGAGITVLVQSSSVFTSALTPLVGIGVVTVERMYPLTLGANIGTTVTGLLASFTADASKVHKTLQLALCHLLFNITGILIWYPIPVMRRVPIKLAKFLGNTTADYRWFAVAYLILLYFLMPLIVFGLSLAGWYVLLAVLLPIGILIVIIIVINVLQSKRPKWLPTKLRSWDWLPLPLRSLAPYDRIITACCYRGKHCRNCCSRDENFTSNLELTMPEITDVSISMPTSDNDNKKFSTDNTPRDTIVALPSD